MLESKQKSRKVKVIPFLVFLFVISLLAVFAWRVVYFSGLIRTGELNFTDYQFVSQASTTDALAAAVASTNGTADVLTSDDPSMGNEDALITIVEFADFGCPYSQEVSYTARSLALEFKDHVRYVYRDFPITDIHPEASAAAEAGECAQDQGMFWEFHDKVYQDQNNLTRDRFIQHARSLNMNVGLFTSCIDKRVHKAEVEEDYAQGLAAGVNATPTFFINGNRIVGSIPPQVFRRIIEETITQSLQ